MKTTNISQDLTWLDSTIIKTCRKESEIFSHTHTNTLAHLQQISIITTHAETYVVLNLYNISHTVTYAISKAGFVCYAFRVKNRKRTHIHYNRLYLFTSVCRLFCFLLLLLLFLHSHNNQRQPLSRIVCKIVKHFYRFFIHRCDDDDDYVFMWVWLVVFRSFHLKLNWWMLLFFSTERPIDGCV